MKRLEAKTGQTMGDTVIRALALANESGEPVTVNFNNVHYVVDPGAPEWLAIQLGEVVYEMNREK